MLLKLEIERCDVIAQGMSFGNAGAYERLIGRAHGEIDPMHPSHRGIALIDQAPRNARGCVTYATDVHLMRPVDPARGNGRLLHEVNNRGRKLLFSNLADGPAGVNDPLTEIELGNAFPLRQGYTLVWCGWDAQASRAKAGLSIDVPVATRDGRPIVQRVRDEFVSGTRIGVLETFRLSATAASLDPARARLTLRCREADVPIEIPATQWSFVDARAIRLHDPAGPRAGWLYELHYDATDPPLQGLGFAATRDVISFLRHSEAARVHTGRAMTHALAIGISQAGRYLRDHLGQGFNRDEQGRRVFDGMLVHIAGIGRVFLNQPFAQPGRTCTQHEDHYFPENTFPFSAAMMTDPITGQTGSTLQGDASDPLLIETNTSTEYWQKGASLLHTDPLGTRDVPLPNAVRAYLIAGTQHGGRAGAASDPGPNVHPRNPHNPMPVLRALLTALDRWVVSGVPPPPSRVPRIDTGTLVAPHATGFPQWPGVTPLHVAHRLAPLADWVHPVAAPQAWCPLVCRVDADGNEVAGIRLPDIAVPLATYTGWNLYRAPYPEGEIADRDGSRLPFASDRAAPEARADPRPSVAERYRSRSDYVLQVKAAVDALMQDGLLLADDAQHYLDRAAGQPGWPD